MIGFLKEFFLWNLSFFFKFHFTVWSKSLFAGCVSLLLKENESAKMDPTTTTTYYIHYTTKIMTKLWTKRRKKWYISKIRYINAVFCAFHILLWSYVSSSYSQKKGDGFEEKRVVIIRNSTKKKIIFLFTNMKSFSICSGV